MTLLGKIAYHSIYKPLARLNYIRSNGGIANVRKIKEGKLAMAKIATTLYSSPTADQLFDVYFLTGKRFWPLTAFCMYSLGKVTKNIRPVFVDDGTLDKKLIKQINTQFPEGIIKVAAETEKIIQQILPVSKYPFINHKRKSYPHIRKLTDIHVGSTGWKLVLDSDMLFFKYPREINNWLINPANPFFLFDPVNSYHYSTDLMQSLTNSNIEPNLNVGAVGLKSEAIDWCQLEDWIEQLENKEGKSYFLEQALSCMLVSGQKLTIASKADYVVMPPRSEIDTPSAVLHHYVDSSKEWYFKDAWKKLM